MASIIVSMEGQSVRRTSGKPKKVIVKERRKHVARCLQQLQVLERQDEAEDRRGQRYRYTPALVLGASNSRYRKALADLKARLTEMLRLKV